MTTSLEVKLGSHPDAANNSLEPTRAFGALLYRRLVSEVVVANQVGPASPSAGGSFRAVRQPLRARGI
jgi:hypothetical protein